MGLLNSFFTRSEFEIYLHSKSNIRSLIIPTCIKNYKINSILTSNPNLSYFPRGGEWCFYAIFLPSIILGIVSAFGIFWLQDAIVRRKIQQQVQVWNAKEGNTFRAVYAGPHAHLPPSFSTEPITYHAASLKIYQRA